MAELTPDFDECFGSLIAQRLPDTNDVAKVYKQSESGQNVFYFFGDGAMPFRPPARRRG